MLLLPTVLVIQVIGISGTAAGIGTASDAMALEFGVLIVYMIFVYLMSKTSSIAGVWTAEWLYNISIGLISLFYIWKADWRKKVI